jgi:hypothetical protein
MCREDKQFDPFAETPVDGVIAAQVNSHIFFHRELRFCRLFIDFPFSFPWAFCQLFVSFPSIGFPTAYGGSPAALMICSLYSNLSAGGDLDLHFFVLLHTLNEFLTEATKFLFTLHT